MKQLYNLCLLLERFLTDYRDLLIFFSRTYAPSEAGQSADPRYLQSCRELPYILFFLQYMQTDPLEFLEAAEKYGLLRQLAQALDYYEKEDGRAAA